MEEKRQPLHAAYERVKSVTKRDWMSMDSVNAIYNLAMLSLRFLQSECFVVDLVSKVPNKAYFSYALYNAGTLISRPANRRLFNPDITYISTNWQYWLEGSISQDNLASMVYTVALAPCLAMELFDRQNKKGPATYFECLIGHIFARSLGVNPQKQTVLLVHGRQVRMTMDFLFEIPNAQNIHLPVKMSTRERVVQAWAHQSLLDSAYGKDYYRGIMILFSETKLATRSREVVEICVPDQWLAYQALLSRMHRIYYFDVPERYQALTNSFPDVIQIKHFSDFFMEKEFVVAR